MESVSHEKSSFNEKQLLIDHNIFDFKYHSDKYINNRYKEDEKEKQLCDFILDQEKFQIESCDEYHKEVLDFLDSKLKVMEDMDLNDECSDGEIETRNINIDENGFSKLEDLKSKKYSNFSKKKINSKSQSKKNNKSKNKNIIINRNGKIKNYNMDNFDFVDIVNLDIEKEIKEKKPNNFFSDKNLLNSIINEMKDM